MIIFLKKKKNKNGKTKFIIKLKMIKIKTTLKKFIIEYKNKRSLVKS